MAFWLGTINTAVLLTSSLTMALAVHAAKKARPKTVSLLLLVTMALGCCFLGIKAAEYTDHIQHHLLPGSGFMFSKVPDVAPPGAELFFCLYFVMTGIHAFHMLLGVSLLSWMTIRVRRGRLSPTAIEMSGLYWHFVDVIWIFLYPLFYLIGGF
jgi:cytochrome c oxidase subunit 3